VSVLLRPVDAAKLDAATIAAVDDTGQLRDVLAFPSHLRDALVRVREARIEPLEAPGGLVIAGMGGSAVGGRLALSVLGPILRAPLVVSDGYSLPGWVGPHTAVLCSSYSGSTDETLSAYDDATRRGAQRLVATTGGSLGRRAQADGVPVLQVREGLQPRAAVAYSLVCALEAAARVGAAPFLHADIEAAADLTDRLMAEWGPDAPEDNLAKTIARQLDGCIPVIAGAELAAAAAYRWKCQFNENTSIPAFASVLPEADHNEIVGWQAALNLGRFAYISLEDPGAHPANRRRAQLTATLAGAGVHTVVRVEAQGTSALERLLSLTVLGDLVSIYAASLRGANPVDIPAIDSLKDQMRR